MFSLNNCNIVFWSANALAFVFQLGRKTTTKLVTFEKWMCVQVPEKNKNKRKGSNSVFSLFCGKKQGLKKWLLNFQAHVEKMEKEAGLAAASYTGYPEEIPTKRERTNSCNDGPCSPIQNDEETPGLKNGHSNQEVSN